MTPGSRAGLAGTPAISHRHSGAKNIVGVEFNIVSDDVPVRLGTGDEVAPEVVAHPSAEMQQKVVGIDVSGASSAPQIAIACVGVEEQSFGPDAGHEVGIDLGRETIAV